MSPTLWPNRGFSTQNPGRPEFHRLGRPPTTQRVSRLRPALTHGPLGAGHSGWLPELGLRPPDAGFECSGAPAVGHWGQKETLSRAQLPQCQLCSLLPGPCPPKPDPTSPGEDGRGDPVLRKGPGQRARRTELRLSILQTPACAMHGHTHVREHARTPCPAACPRRGLTGDQGPLGPSQPSGVTSAKGLSQRLHWRPMTPGRQAHCPVSASQARLWEPAGKQSQGRQASRSAGW